MTKKGVRKATMDSVLNQVLSASTSSLTSTASNETSHSGGKKEYVPPSLALLGKTPTNGPTSTPGPSVAARVRTTSRGNTGPKVPSRPPSRAGVASPTPTDTSGGGGIGATGGTSLADIRNVYVSVFRLRCCSLASCSLGRLHQVVISKTSLRKWRNPSR